MIVAPARDIPGTSAKHCAQPIFNACTHDRSSTSSTRIRRGRCSTHRITHPPITNASATGTGRNKWAMIKLPNVTPKMAAGRNAIARLVAKRCDRRSATTLVSSFRNLFLAIFPDDRQHRTALNDDLEHFRGGRRQPEQITRKNQVTRGRDRQEFRQAFDNTHDEGLEQKSVADWLEMSPCTGLNHLPGAK